MPTRVTNARHDPDNPGTSVGPRRGAPGRRADTVGCTGVGWDTRTAADAPGVAITVVADRGGPVVAHPPIRPAATIMATTRTARSRWVLTPGESTKTSLRPG